MERRWLVRRGRRRRHRQRGDRRCSHRRDRPHPRRPRCRRDRPCLLPRCFTPRDDGRGRRACHHRSGHRRPTRDRARRRHRIVTIVRPRRLDRGGRVASRGCDPHHRCHERTRGRRGRRDAPRGSGRPQAGWSSGRLRWRRTRGARHQPHTSSELVPRSNSPTAPRRSSGVQMDATSRLAASPVPRSGTHGPDAASSSSPGIRGSENWIGVPIPHDW